VKVLQNLLREQIPVRDLLTILETLADFSPMTKDIDTLSEYARQSLARTITKQYLTPEGKIPVVTLDQNAEKVVAEAVQQTEHGYYLMLDPNLSQTLMENLGENLQKFSTVNQQPIVLCSAQIRLPLKRFIDRFIPNLVVLSYNEILSTVKIQSLGTVRIGNAH
jgi:flagellar biosynthesis protein FlhA